MKTKILLTSLLLTIFSVGSIAQENTWTRKADFGGEARKEAIGFSVGTKGYIGTGETNVVDDFRGDFWEYDPSADIWTQKAYFEGGRRTKAVGFSIGSKGYIGLGYSSDDWEYKKDFWEYDPDANTWTQKADFGGPARFDAVGFNIGNKGYIGTGAGDYPYFPRYKDFWEYNPAADKWTQKADFGGTARKQAVGFGINNKGYLGTGDDGSYRNDFWEYDPALDQWTRKTDFGGDASSNDVGFSIGSKGYVQGNTFWEYDASNDKWTHKADFGGGARISPAGFSIGNKGYIGTGYLWASQKDFWEYTPDDIAVCNPPSNLSVIGTTNGSAKLSWSLPGSTIGGFMIRYWPVGSEAIKERLANATSTKVTLNNLKPNISYRWKMRNVCSDATSEWVKGPGFTTALTVAADNSDLKVVSSPVVSIRPNPGNGNFVLQMQLPAKQVATTITVYNNEGKQMWKQDAGLLSGTVNKNILLNNMLSPGIYMLVIERNDTKLVQKIVVTK